MANRPEPEHKIDAALARRLLQSQAPHLADLRLTPLSRGWDNTSLRLGDDLIVRLPHRGAAAPLIENEQRWLPHLAAQVTLAIPSPVFAGTADAACGYPWPWSVVPWFNGHEAAGAALADSKDTARQLGDFLNSLHAPGPDNAPANAYRGQPLDELRPAVAQRLALLDNQWDRGRLQATFDRAADATPAAETVWLHADLHLRNLVVHEGKLAAVIDWGDICTGDRATDLAAAYMLVPNDLDQVRAHAGADDDAWQRAVGWAVHFGLIYTVMSDDEPIQRAIGENLLGVVLDTVN